jgi:hypothetical protein
VKKMFDNTASMSVYCNWLIAAQNPMFFNI